MLEGVGSSVEVIVTDFSERGTNARIHFLKDFLEFGAVELHFCGFDLVDIMAGQPTPQRTPTRNTGLIRP